MNVLDNVIWENLAFFRVWKSKIGPSEIEKTRTFASLYVRAKRTKNYRYPACVEKTHVFALKLHIVGITGMIVWVGILFAQTTAKTGC